MSAGRPVEDDDYWRAKTGIGFEGFSNVSSSGEKWINPEALEVCGIGQRLNG
jgi:hypothetical protein